MLIPTVEQQTLKELVFPKKVVLIMLKKNVIFILLIALAVILSSCAPNTDTQLEGDTPSPSVQGEEQRAPAAPPDALRIYSYSSDTLNPIFTQNYANLNMLKLVFEPLVWCDSSMRPVSVLAESWKVSPDGRTWTINLRSGVKFHDGSYLTSSDVAASLKAAQKKESFFSTNMEGVESITPYSGAVQIRLKTPHVSFISRLEIPIVKLAKANEVKEFPPVGTGPYTYAEMNNKVVYLRANDNWWNPEKPNIKTIEAHLLPDKNTALFSHDAGEIDVVPTDTINAGKYVGSEDTTVHYYDTTNFVFLGINNRNKTLSNPQVRQAIAYGINQVALNEKLLQNNGNTSNTFINPVWYMYDQNTTTYQYNPGTARDILAQAGFGKKMPDIELLLDNENEEKIRFADFFTQAMSDIGIRVRIKSVKWENYDSLIARRAYDMFVGEISLSSDINPEMLLASGAKGTVRNFFEYQSPEMDDVLAALDLSQNEAQLVEQYHAVQKQFATDLPFIPLYYKKAALLVNKRVEGVITPVRNNIFYTINKWTLKQY